MTSGKDSKVIITSTANGVGNMFHKIYESGIHDQSEYKPFTINWYDVLRVETKSGKIKPSQTLQKHNSNKSTETHSWEQEIHLSTVIHLLGLKALETPTGLRMKLESMRN